MPFILISMSILQAQNALPIQNPTVKSHLANYSSFFHLGSFPSNEGRNLFIPLNKTSVSALQHENTHIHIFKLFFVILGPGLNLVTVLHIADTHSFWKRSVSMAEISFAPASLQFRKHFLYAFCAPRIVCIGFRPFVMCVLLSL